MRTSSPALFLTCLLLAACGDSFSPTQVVDATGDTHNGTTPSAPPPTSTPGTGSTPPAPIASLDKGVWMKGDLHVHSRHSTDSTNNPVRTIIALAETVGMDYLCITDHDNHVQGAIAQNTWADPEFKSNSVLLLYGAEITTSRGHINSFSATPYDHQRLFDVRDALDTKISATAKELGVQLSANHPSGADNFGFSFDMVDSVEVWNSAIWSTNAGNLQIWTDMLGSGRNLTARGGSDSHHGYPELGAGTPEFSQSSIQAGGNNVGTPTTWVYATERSGAAVVAALANGRVSISSNPNAPRVELYADLNADGVMDMMMGDNTLPTGQPVTFQVRMAGGTLPALLPYTVTVIKDGATLSTLRIIPPATTIGFSDTPTPGVRSYYRVQVEGQQAVYPQVPAAAALSANMVGLSNPIYFNFNRPR